MRIAVSAVRPGLNSAVDPRFARCRYVIFVDSDTMEIEPLENPNLMGLAATGTQLAQLIASKGTQVLLTGSIGPAAQQALSEARVEVYTNVRGTVKEAVDNYIRGAFMPAPPVSVEAPVASVPEPAPTPARPGPARPAPYQSAPSPELLDLRSKLMELSRLLNEIQQRLDEMGKRG